jgi:hypothetical protein
MFHQDWDLEGLTSRDALAKQAASMDLEERGQLQVEIAAALSGYPTSEAFDDYFVRLGAEHWEGDIRSEIERLLATL